MEIKKDFTEDVIISKEDLIKLFEYNKIRYVETEFIKESEAVIQVPDIKKFVECACVERERHIFYWYKYYDDKVDKYVFDVNDVVEMTTKNPDYNEKSNISNQMLSQVDNCKKSNFDRPYELTLCVIVQGKLISMVITHNWFESYSKFYDLKTLDEYKEMIKL
ncbi:hypothetical protein M2475_000474 [Breznakia sp. PF5-3]|uniref:hypothetical protein n=1 Tax=unclassified Breznakia TaxID=2623764 RepID=UPI00240506E4|nr:MULTISPECIES: hypothetical protein [unclassified Breznakia]MDF9824124.1 hypothetical protein [Breznakia sp. PM6-1]MDF9834922.1 hypothetical protein [Breznakia sp. PF5-3]MDF9837209.1 hypothetical protein [Breznakia sp. PFB2-8]MDF9859199.1 hypothetical protein [Breznakia sp. PH5-24]